MAFSTQKEFFHVPFMNQALELECREACVKLKTYDSTIDDRSWAMDEAKQSKFLSDLVTCNMPAECPADCSDIGLGAVRCTEQTGAVSRGAAFSGGDAFKGGDSLLECANKSLGKLDEILNDKKSLQKQLAVSKERLRCSKEENDKIKNILNKKFDHNLSKDFHNKIQKLSSAGKINKCEENDLLQIYYKFDDMTKAFEVAQAENMYLQRLIEKLSQRATMDTIKVDPEKSTDLNYLQDQVNKLRKELILLRKFEDQKLKCNQKNNPTVIDRDAAKIKDIVAERNSLREKCKNFKDLEKKVRDLQKKAKEADNMSDSLSSNLSNQTKYINDIEREMQRMQKHYEEQINKLKYTEEILKCQISDMKDELCRAQCKAQKSECLQMEIGCLRNELLKRELALSDYDCQYKQLMYVVDELRGGAIQNLADCQTQTCDPDVDDLEFFASATLNEITKELNTRGAFAGTVPAPTGAPLPALRTIFPPTPAPRLPGSISNMSPQECCKALEQLEKLVQQLENEKAALMKQVKGMRDEIDQLEKAVTARKEEYKRQANNLEGITETMGKMEQEIKKQGRESMEIQKGLRESIGLVKDISAMQEKNKELASAVNAISSRDDQKAMDELRRQLQEEMEKNARLYKENDGLRHSIPVSPSAMPVPAAASPKPVEPQQAAAKPAEDKAAPAKSAEPSAAAAKPAESPADAKTPQPEAGKPTAAGAKAAEVAKADTTTLLKEEMDKNARLHKEKDGTRHSMPASPEELQTAASPKPVQPQEAAAKPAEDKAAPSKAAQPSAAAAKPGQSPAAAAAKPGESPAAAAVKPGESPAAAKKPEAEATKPTAAEAKPAQVDKRDTATLLQEMDENPRLNKDKDGLRHSMPAAVASPKPVEPQEAAAKPAEDKAAPAKSAEPSAARTSKPAAARTSKPGEAKPKAEEAKPAEDEKPIDAQVKAEPTDALPEQGPKQTPVRKPILKQLKTDPEGKGDAEPEAYTKFVDENVGKITINLKAGNDLENEVRKILNSFIEECGYLFCRCTLPRSKFSALCYRIIHQGLNSLSLKELLYMHKKISFAADKLEPGCLINLLFDEQNTSYDKRKCCTCKSSLCCNNSEEMLIQKVMKLEKDIQMAKEYLDNYNAQPLPSKRDQYNEGQFSGYSQPEAEKNTTYRPSNPLSKCSSKQLKQLKARILKNAELAR